jgi:hypothetical protein
MSATTSPDSPPPYEPVTDESPATEVTTSPLAPLGAISRGVNEAIGRALALGDPALRDLLIRIGNAVDDLINDLEDVD